MNHVIGIMAMIFGFIGMALERYGGATFCFFFAFLLWCFLAVDEYKEWKKR